MASNSGATAAIIASTTAIMAGVAKQRQTLLAMFRDQGAVSPCHAIEADSVDPALKSVLAWYQAEKVILVSDDGKLYLDEAALSAQQVTQKSSAIKVFWILFVIIVAVAALVVALVALG